MHQNLLVKNHLEKVLHHQIISQENEMILSRKDGKTHRIKVIGENDEIDMKCSSLKAVDVLAIVAMDASVFYYYISVDESSLHICNNVVVKKGQDDINCDD